MNRSALEVVVGAIAVLAGLMGLLWLWIESRCRRVFVPKEDFQGLGERVTKMKEAHAETRALADKNRDRIALVENEYKHQSQMFNELVVKPLEQVAERLEKISETQERHGNMLAAGAEVQKSLGRAIDDLKASQIRSRNREQ